MTVRAHFERKLNELNDEILRMGRLVEAELKLALEAFTELKGGQRSRPPGQPRTLRHRGKVLLTHRHPATGSA